MRFRAELLERPFAPAPIVTRESSSVAMRESGAVRQASLVSVYTVRLSRQLM